MAPEFDIKVKRAFMIIKAKVLEYYFYIFWKGKLATKICRKYVGMSINRVLLTRAFVLSKRMLPYNKIIIIVALEMIPFLTSGLRKIIVFFYL